MKEYGVMYAKVVFPVGHRLNWLKYTFITSLLPKELKQGISDLSNKINDKYKDVIVIPMDNKIHPGCVTEPEYIEEISKSIYSGFSDLFHQEDCIRVCYTILELDESEIEKVKSTHEIGTHSSKNNYLKMCVFNKLDSDDTPGVFKI